MREINEIQMDNTKCDSNYLNLNMHNEPRPAMNQVYSFLFL